MSRRALYDGGMTRLLTSFTAILSFFTAFYAFAQSPTLPTPRTNPVVVELFTSKYCPNCPAVEKKLHTLAETDKNMLILQQHVDYWDSGTRKDPFGLAEITERQYDYSNRFGSRPGEVYTPMPVLNGSQVAAPPLWLNWERIYKEALAAPRPVMLTPTLTESGALRVVLPAALARVHEVWVMGLAPIDGTSANVQRVQALAQAPVAQGVATLPKNLVPRTPQLAVLAQKDGMGALVGFGLVGRK